MLVTFKEHQKLLLETGSLSGSPTYQEFTFDQVKAALIQVSKTKGTSRRSKSVETAASRHVGLLCRAATSGAWATGALVEPLVMLDKLTVLLGTLTPAQLVLLTDSAKDSVHILIDALSGKYPAHINGLKSVYLR